MGQLDQFAKRMFAEETEAITRGAAAWQDPAESRLFKVQADGLLLVRDGAALSALFPPWPAAGRHAEVLLELKRPGPARHARV